jgi:hypothetical protein
MMPTRRAVGYAAGLLALIGLVVCGVVVANLVTGRDRALRPAPTTGNARADLAQRLTEFSAQLSPMQPYRDPTPSEQRRAVDALTRLVTGGSGALASAAEGFGALGFDHVDQVDPATGRRYAMFSTRPGDRRPWGVVLVDLSAPVHLVIEVPHPNFDLKTELVGARLFDATPGAVLLMAGAHRRAERNAADVAHNDRSMFSVLAAALAHQGLPQVQLHGFADGSLPGRDAVVSTGDAAPSGSAQRVADRLASLGLAVCRPWTQTCGELEGTLNVQAREAGRVGTVFIHLEMNNRVRSDDRLRDAVADAIAAARVDDS